MILCFLASNIAPSTAVKRIADLRRLGRLVCLPREPGEMVSSGYSLPFTAALLFYAQDPTGLPARETVQRICPGLPIVAVGGEPVSGQWRTFAEADYEFPAELSTGELSEFLDRLRQKRGLREPRQTSLYLANRRHAMVVTARLSLTADEQTLLRVLSVAARPVPSALLRRFFARPGQFPSGETVGYHAACLREKTEAVGVPPLVKYVNPDGYCLAPPYDIPLPE